MTDWTATKVRETFITYFQHHPKYPHAVENSAPVLPHNDDSLLFINSGMAPFKQIFQGALPQSHRLYNTKRIVDTQKCIRAGGKHNDLDDVGKDTYHHTFFEMLGNWSFGDYFKTEACTMAWELLTRVYGLEADRLYVTYFEGSEKDGLACDDEAKKIWLDLGVAEDHILPGNAKDNFWEMGATGPCGPCSEIHYDRIGERNAASLVNMDDPDVLEIWNLVFMQFNRDADGSLKELPQKHIDTGSGFERLVSVLQDKRSNYDTDVFQPLFQAIQKMTNARAYTGKIKDQDVDGIDTAYRVVADHVRTLSFAIADGTRPGVSKAGYVLRRVVRRGARYVRTKFDAQIGTFFSRLALVLVEQMSPIFPEIKEKYAQIKEVLDEEEQLFARTLDAGERKFKEFADAAKASESKTLPGAQAWLLNDSYGFPPDLTAIMCEENGLTIDEAGFEVAKATSIAISKSNTKSSATVTLKLDVHDLHELKETKKIQQTDDAAKFSESPILANLLAIFSQTGFVSQVSDESLIGLILDQTNFYAESGGQEGDHGILSISGQDSPEFEFKVVDTQSSGGYVLHLGHIVKGVLDMSMSSKLLCQVDQQRRALLKANHTGTHVMNFALREHLGDHIDQKGSLVAANKLRFDFSHKASLSLEEILSIEATTRSWIKRDEPVFAANMDLAAAQQIPGLRAVFGEAYPNPVRVVTLAFSTEDIMRDVNNPKWRQTSVEFCGGTHVSSTGAIQEFVIVEQAGIGQGTRRIVAYTKDAAQKCVAHGQSLNQKFTEIDSTSNLLEKDAALKLFVTELSAVNVPLAVKLDLEKKSTAARKELNTILKKESERNIKSILDDIENELKSQPYYVKQVVAGLDVKQLSTIATAKSIRSANKPIYLFSVDANGDKIQHVNWMPSHNQDFDAKSWSKQVQAILGGKGGGKAETFSGVGTNVDAVSDAVRDAIQTIEKYLRIS